MKKETQKKTLVGLTVILAAALLVGFSIANFNNAFIAKQGSAHVDFTPGSVHATITIEKDGETILDEYHAGAVTKLGLNSTFAKLTGNSTAYNMTTYDLNLTYVGIGNQGSLDTDSTILPGEWNRTSALQHTLAYNSCNWTAVFYPDSGPYTADCLGVYYESAGNSLFLYDTFSEVTGIDDTFTITIEVKLSAS